MPALGTRAQGRRKEVADAQKEFEQAKLAATTLKQNSDDPDANLTQGRQLCLRKGDWEQGLPLLVKGSDAELSALAKKDLARPEQGPAQIEIGDGWWSYAEAHPTSGKAHLQLRAAYWYQFALPQSNGLTLERLEKRIAEVRTPGGLRPATLTGSPLRRLLGHSGRVNKVVFSADGKRALSVSADGTARVWNVQTGKELFVLKSGSEELETVAWAADGHFACTATTAGVVEVVDVDTRSALGGQGFGRDIQMHCLAYQSDNQRFLAADSKGAVHQLRITANVSSGMLGGYTGPNEIRALALSADDRLCLCGKSDGSLCVLDLDQRRVTQRVPSAHAQMVLGVALSKDGRLAVSGSADKTVRVWNVSDWQPVRTITSHQDRVTSVAVIPDGKKIVTGSDDKTIRVWETASGRELRRFIGHRGGVTSVAISPDGRYILSGSADKMIFLWDLGK